MDDFAPRLATLQRALADAQAQARRLRSEAFVRYVPLVAGQRLEPLTLTRYNQLVAFESPFVVGGPCTDADLFTFLWVCSPQFGQFAHEERRAFFRAVECALRPPHPTLNAVCRLLAPFPRFRWLSRWCGPTSAELREAAVSEVERLVVEAIGDFPAGSKDGEPIPFALQAQVLGLLRRELGLPFEESRSLPLKELVQHIREAVHVASKGKASLLTRAEAQVWHAYEALVDERAAEEAKKK